MSSTFSFTEAFERFRTKDCSGIALTPEDKQLIGDLIIDGTLTARELAERFHLDVRRVERYAKAIRDGRPFFVPHGRPAKLDDIAIESLKAFLKTKKDSQDTANDSEFEQKVREAMVETNVRRGGSDLAVKLSRTWLWRLRRDLHAARTAGQIKTRARVAAEADPRNAFSEALLFKAFQEGISPHLIANIDSVQYVLSPDNEGAQQLVWIPEASDDSPATDTAPSSGDLNFAIKSHVLITAAGAVGPMVLMIADPDLDPEDLVVKSLVGLTHSAADPTAEGFLVILQSRQANRAFFRWYLRDVLAPFVEKARTAQELPGMYAFISHDGEQKGVEAFMEPDSVTILDKALILDAKHSASYSARSNALDAGKLFLTTKNRGKASRETAGEGSRGSQKARRKDSCQRCQEARRAGKGSASTGEEGGKGSKKEETGRRSPKRATNSDETYQNAGSSCCHLLRSQLTWHENTCLPRHSLVNV